MHSKPALGVAVLAPATAETLTGLGVAEGFDVYVGGRREQIHALLREVATTPGGRVAVAVAQHARIVGYLCARPPDEGTRLHHNVWVIELSAFEVIPSYRQGGIFGEMFARLFRDDLEGWIAYVVADPALRERKEKVRAFRERMEAVLGPAGFVPLPSDDPQLHPHPSSTLFARVGRGVPQPDVDEFFAQLTSRSRTSVAISIRDSALRNLVRTELERNGFAITSVAANGIRSSADVLVTDKDAGRGQSLTVRLGEARDPLIVDGILWYPFAQMDRLGDVLRSELGRMRSGHG